MSFYTTLHFLVFIYISLFGGLLSLFFFLYHWRLAWCIELGLIAYYWHKHKGVISFTSRIKTERVKLFTEVLQVKLGVLSDCHVDGRLPNGHLVDQADIQSIQSWNIEAC